MDAEIKRKWVEALRSGKYSQCRDALRKESDYCCLGVLCDLQAPEEWRNEMGIFKHRYEQGIPDEGIRGPARLKYDDASDLAEMNDSGKSFAEIADYIEQNL